MSDVPHDAAPQALFACLFAPPSAAGASALTAIAAEFSPRYERHLRLPDKVIGWLDTASVRTEIDKRWEVTAADVVQVVLHATGIPQDMVFRDVGDRLKGIEERLGKRAPLLGRRTVQQRAVLGDYALEDREIRVDPHEVVQLATRDEHEAAPGREHVLQRGDRLRRYLPVSRDRAVIVRGQ